MALFTEVERVEVWDRRQAGESNRSIGRRLGKAAGSIRAMVESSGGVRPAVRRRSVRQLSLVEREEISRGVAAGESLRGIGRRLGRAPSTLSREVARNGGRHRYRAHRADRAAWQRARRPQGCKLASNHTLRAVVEELLVERWSPQQIAGWLERTYPDDEEMRVSHETIYLTLFIQARGGLKHQLTQHLRTRRANRRPKGARPPSGKGQIVDPVMISERPAAVEDRAVPGHWEGDLIVGKGGRSAVATLVERTTRTGILIRIENKTARHVADRIADHVVTLPDQLAKTLTWDQGKELADHAEFTIATGIPVYFCDPHSPWQRGSNENWNGLVRQFLPKGTDLSGHTQDELDEIARLINTRPRKTLDWDTPAERYNQLVADNT